MFSKAPVNLCERDDATTFCHAGSQMINERKRPPLSAAERLLHRRRSWEGGEGEIRRDAGTSRPDNQCPGGGGGGTHTKAALVTKNSPLHLFDLIRIGNRRIFSTLMTRQFFFVLYFGYPFPSFEPPPPPQDRLFYWTTPDTPSRRPIYRLFERHFSLFRGQN